MAEMDEVEHVFEIIKMDIPLILILLSIDLFVYVNAKLFLQWYQNVNVSTKDRMIITALFLNPFATCLVFYSGGLYHTARNLSCVICACGCILLSISTLLIGANHAIPNKIGIITKSLGIFIVTSCLCSLLNPEEVINPFVFYCGIMSYTLGTSVTILNFAQESTENVTTD